MQVQTLSETRASSNNDPGSSKAAIVFANKCNAIYEAMLRRLKRKKDPEAVLRWVKVVAAFAEFCHVGRFADGSLENPLLEIGERLEQTLPEPHVDTQQKGRPRVLHVATSLYKVGGHTRLIRNWLNLDHGVEHSLALTEQDVREVPDWLAAAVTERGGVINDLSAASSLLEKARSLRSIARTGYDAVILHHHPDDVVPSVAFATADCPPVALMNHADHVFGMGTTIADVVLNVRGFGEHISETRRFAKKNFLVPIPISNPDLSITRAEARRRLQLPADQIVLLSMGPRYKYTATNTHDFFATTGKLLAQNPDAHVYVIGMYPDDAPRHERIHFLGVVEDPAIYRLSADIYLDSMPYGSLTALLEAAALGVCPVLMYCPPSPQYDLSEDVGLSGLALCTASEEEYIAHVNDLIRDTNLRQTLASRIRENVLSHHFQNWPSYLEPVYQYLKINRHSPARIPSAPFMQTKDDMALWEFKSMLQRSTSLVKRAVDTRYNMLTLKDIVGLFLVSVATRDNKFSYSEERHWLSMFVNKLIGREGKV